MIDLPDIQLICEWLLQNNYYSMQKSQIDFFF